MSKAATKLARLTAQTVNLKLLGGIIPGEFTRSEIAQAAGAVKNRDVYHTLMAVYTGDAGMRKAVQAFATNALLDRITETAKPSTLEVVGAQALGAMVTRELCLDRNSREWNEAERARQSRVTVGEWRKSLAAPYADTLAELQSMAEDGARQLIRALAKIND